MGHIQEDAVAKLKNKIHVTSSMHSHLILADLDEIFEEFSDILPKEKEEYLKSAMKILVEMNLEVINHIVNKLG